MNDFTLCFLTFQLAKSIKKKINSLIKRELDQCMWMENVPIKKRTVLRTILLSMKYWFCSISVVCLDVKTFWELIHLEANYIQPHVVRIVPVAFQTMIPDWNNFPPVLHLLLPLLGILIDTMISKRGVPVLINLLRAAFSSNLSTFCHIRECSASKRNFVENK